MWLFKKIKEIIDSYHTPKVLNNVHGVIQDLDSNKPTPGIAGRIFIATDTKYIYFDTGSQWIIIGMPTFNDLVNIIKNGKYYEPSDSEYEIYARKDDVVSTTLLAGGTKVLKQFIFPNDFPQYDIWVYYEANIENPNAETYIGKDDVKVGGTITYYDSQKNWVSRKVFVPDVGPNTKVQVIVHADPGQTLPIYVRNFRILGKNYLTPKKYDIS